MPTRRAVTLPLVAPIVPVLRAQPFDDPSYVFEPKYDGFRGLLYLSGQECHFRSKRGNVLKHSSSSVTGSGRSYGLRPSHHHRALARVCAGEGERYSDEQNQERFVFEGGRFCRAWGRHGVRSHGAIASAVVAARAMLRSIPANTIR